MTTATNNTEPAGVTPLVRVISLPDATQRRQQVKDMLADWDLAWSFLDAQRGYAPEGGTPAAAPPDRQRAVFGRALSPGEIGCFRSHVAAWRELIGQTASDWMLVLEDDVWVDTGFDFQVLPQWLEARGITYLRLFCRWWQPGVRADWLDERQLMRLKTDPFGTQAYLIHRQAAAKLVAQVQEILRPVDDELGRFWEHGLQSYMLFPFPVAERAVPSSLLSDRGASGQGRPNRSPARLQHKARDWIAKRLYLLRAGRRLPNGRPFR